MGLFDLTGRTAGQALHLLDDGHFGRKIIISVPRNLIYKQTGPNVNDNKIKLAVP